MSDHSGDEAGEEEKQEGLQTPAVGTKYLKAADIANNAITRILSLIKPGVLVFELCKAGDDFINEETGKLYNKDKKGKAIKMEKGIGFPTCVCANHVVGHFSPNPDDKTVVAENDFVKIDLGVHIDGYCVVAAHTVKVGKDGVFKEKITGKYADCFLAAHYAAEAAIRLLKPGKTNTEVTKAIEAVASAYGVTPISGVLSHNMERFVIDGQKCIQCKTDPENKVEEAEFEPYEAYAIDIVMSSGDGKPKDADARTTVYKRAADQTYQLKVQAARKVFAEVVKNHPVFPFSIRSLSDEVRPKAMFGLKECISHGLVHPYPVLFEKEGESVCHLKFTALVMPSGTNKICGLPLALEQFESEKKIEDEALKALLATSVNPKKKNKKKKK